MTNLDRSSCQRLFYTIFVILTSWIFPFSLYSQCHDNLYLVFCDFTRIVILNFPFFQLHRFVGISSFLNWKYFPFFNICPIKFFEGETSRKTMPCGGSCALLKICENLILYCGKCWLLNSALSLNHNCCSSFLFINRQLLLIIGMYLLNSDWKNKILYSTH